MIKENNKRICITIDKEIAERLELMCESLKMSKTDIICSLINNSSIEREIIRIKNSV